MTKPRLDGLYLLIFGCVLFILLGLGMESADPSSLTDFRGVYFPTQCLIRHCDPYNESAVFRLYQAEGGIRPTDSAYDRQVATRLVYLPGQFPFMAPFALLPWAPAHILWIMLAFGSFIFGSFLIWNLGADFSPILSGALIGFLAANSEVLIITGNPAAIAISLCAVAVWCFLRERFVVAGILCLAISLLFKPQDSGLVWLYFLLAGGLYRKRALQTLLATVALALPGVLWVWCESPHWMQELHSNISRSSLPGDINDPGSAAPSLLGAIDLQTVFSAFHNNPHIYNLLTYLVCGPIILVWILITLRSRSSLDRAWLALAAISALTMLPIYHRQYDSRLILLTVPACAMLWAARGKLAWIALLVNTAGFVLTGDVPQLVLMNLVRKVPSTIASSQTLTHAMVFRTPLILLLMGTFYLWVYASRRSAPTPSAGPQSRSATPTAPTSS